LEEETKRKVHIGSEKGKGTKGNPEKEGKETRAGTVLCRKGKKKR